MTNRVGFKRNNALVIDLNDATKLPLETLQKLLAQDTPLGDIKFRVSDKQYKLSEVLVVPDRMTSSVVKDRLLTATNGGQKQVMTSDLGLWCEKFPDGVTHISSNIPHLIIFQKNPLQTPVIEKKGDKATAELEEQGGKARLILPVDPDDPNLGTRGVPIGVFNIDEHFAVIATPSVTITPNGRISPLTWAVQDKGHCHYYPDEAKKLADDLVAASRKLPKHMPKPSGHTP